MSHHYNNHEKDHSPRHSGVAHGRNSNLTKTLISRYAAQQEKHSLKIDHSDTEYESLEEIIGFRWKIFSVSPLYKLEYSEHCLKQYAAKLKEFLRQRCPLMYSDINAQFVVVEGLTKTEYDFEAIKVEVTCTAKGRKGTSYKGYFMSWGASKPFSDEGFVDLPILLCRGSAVFQSLVHNMLVKSFNCCINQMNFAEEEFFWLTAVLLNMYPSTNKRSVMFHYLQDKRMKAICEFALPLKSLQELWKCIHKENGDILCNEVECLYNWFNKHVLCVFGLDMRLCRLARIKFPDIDLSSKGIFSSSSIELTEIVLSFMGSLFPCIENAAPKMSVPSE